MDYDLNGLFVNFLLYYNQMLAQIRGIIEEAMPGAKVFVSDPLQDGQHLQAIVVYEGFRGLSLVQQHRKVLSSLSQQFEGPLHALAVKTFTPDQWERTRSASKLQ